MAHSQAVNPRQPSFWYESNPAWRDSAQIFGNQALPKPLADAQKASNSKVLFCLEDRDNSIGRGIAALQ